MIDPRESRALLAVAVVVTLACACGPRAASDLGAPGHEPSSSASTPAPTPADALARRIFRAAGGESLGQVAELRFRFVVLDHGQQRMAAFHRWDLRGNRDHVTWTDKVGRQLDAVVDLRSREATGLVDAVPASGESLHGLATDAYARWVNDSYWLMVPLKVLDAGVERELEPDRPCGAATCQVLRLRFDHVGLTPGDTYWLIVDPRSDRIVRWEMILETQKPPPHGFDWSDYRTLGPIALAHRHVSDDGGLEIDFTETLALAALDDHDFQIADVR